MSALLAGALISGGIGLGKAIIGGVQSISGNKQMKRLLANRPKYDISKGYLDAYSTYKGLASSQMPGYDQTLGQIGQSTAKAMTNAEQGAMSSNQYMGAVLNSQDKELEAVRGLGIASAQWRSQQQQNLAQAQNQMGQLQDTQFQQNQIDPWNMKMNMANEKNQAGAQNLFNGLGDMGSSIMNFAGTKYYTDALKGMQPQNGIAASKGFNPWQQFSKPVQGGLPSAFNPQQDLNNTTANMFNAWRNK